VYRVYTELPIFYRYVYRVYTELPIFYRYVYRVYTELPIFYTLESFLLFCSNQLLFTSKSSVPLA